MSSSPIIEKSLANPPHLSEMRKSPELSEPDHGSEREEHGHGVEWAELVRIGFVTLAAAAVWFRLMGAVSAHQRNRHRCYPDRRISDFQGSLREHR